MVFSVSLCLAQLHVVPENGIHRKIDYLMSLTPKHL